MTGVLEAEESPSGRKVSLPTPAHRRLDFVTGIGANAVPNPAPSFVSVPPQSATGGTPLSYQVVTNDAEGQAVPLGLPTGPGGMTIDSTTGLLQWTPPAGTASLAPEVIEAFDSRGAVSLQRFVLAIAGGNRAPEFVSSLSAVSSGEGQLFEFELVAVDPESQPLTYWADGLPAGATFDPATRAFSGLPG